MSKIELCLGPLWKQNYPFTCKVIPVSKVPVIGAMWLLSLAILDTNGYYYLHMPLVLFQTPDSFTGLAIDNPEEHPSPRINKKHFAGQGLLLSHQPSCLQQQNGFLLANSFLAKEKNDQENIIGFKGEKEKKSVKLIKRKHSLDPLLLLLFVCFLCCHPRWAILLPLGCHLPFMFQANRKGPSAKA